MAIDTIKSTAVLDGAIATADIADDAVTTDKLANAINTDIAAKAPTASPAFTGNVGIGTTPASKLHILDSTDGGASLSTAIQIGRRGGTGDNAYLQTLHSGSDAVSALTVKIGSTERLRIQSGGGISFNGDTAAANALDDYEEGTWSPTYTDDSGNVITNLTNQTGRYVKVGNLVYIGGGLRTQGSSNASGLSGSLNISGLPFTQVSTEAAGTVGFFTHESSGSYNAPTQLPRTSPVTSNTTRISIYKYSGTGGRTVRFQVSDLNMSGNSNFIFFSGTYEAS